ncbi:ABC transporter ATP-binding protein [Streptomyces sp. NPDC059883]|uniref:ABC transporter ATP-binding protein n=1 Tax=unclassified Streptomyces TaxID=2593676 RepID=UPI00364ED4A2
MSAPERRGPAPQRGPGLIAGPSLERSLDFRRSAVRLLRTMAPERRLVLGVLAAGTAAVGLAVVLPKILGHATDLVVSGAGGPYGVDYPAVARVLAVVLSLNAVSAALTWAQTRLTMEVVQRAGYRLREEAQTKLSRVPLTYFDKQPRGEVLSRTTNDIDNIIQTMQQAFAQMVRGLLTLVGVLAMMFWISPALALIILATVPVSVLAAARIGKRAQPQFVSQWAVTGRLNGHVEEMYTGHAEVLVFGRKREAVRTFEKHNEELYEASFRAQFISGVIQPALSFVGNLTYVLIAVAGGLRVASGTLSIGDVQAFVQYSYEFNGPVTQLASMANLLQSGIASAERVFDLLDEDEEVADEEVADEEVADEEVAEVASPEGDAAADTGVGVGVGVGAGAGRTGPGTGPGTVSFEKVSFRYEPAKPLIEDVSLVVEPGQTVAIVGPTGAGKTTLVNLLMRFYEVTGGRITLDGVDIARIPRERLRSGIGMVLQDTWLFGGTIADNIAYGVPGDASRERIVEAARATHADRFIRTLPDGYDTVVDEEGGGLSTGEKQLLTIARAFLAEPAILVLDEATSSVDTRTEVLIQRAMSSLRSGRTSFVIAHRLSTIRDADVILVMENGAIVEQGSHDELLAAEGAYARLYASQFAALAV